MVTLAIRVMEMGKRKTPTKKEIDVLIRKAIDLTFEYFEGFLTKVECKDIFSLLCVRGNHDARLSWEQLLALFPADLNVLGVGDTFDSGTPGVHLVKEFCELIPGAPEVLLGCVDNINSPRENKHLSQLLAKNIVGLYRTFVVDLYGVTKNTLSQQLEDHLELGVTYRWIAHTPTL